MPNAPSILACTSSGIALLLPSEGRRWRGGQPVLGWEVYPGLLLAFDAGFARATEHNAHPMLSNQSYDQNLTMITLSYVFYPGGKKHKLRRPDPRRGSDWKWYNPDTSGKAPGPRTR